VAARRRALIDRAWVAVLAVLGACVAASCGGAADGPAARASAAGTGGRVDLTLVAYSTPEVVYEDVVADFARTPAGAGVSIAESFGASGDQSRAVVAGLPADVVSFSLEPDMDRLVRKGLVAPGWADTPTHGMVSESVVVFVVRRGNPEHIRAWRDLLRPGLAVVTPNPATSGSAKWNVLAAYGAASRHGRDPAAGVRFVRELLGGHVKVQPKSAREALQSFTAGTGDVLLSYENEAITAQRKGRNLDYVIPRDTILIENPIATTTGSSRQASAFVRYLLSRPAQERFAAWGYRPVEPSVAAEHARRFPTPGGLFTIRDLGGWRAVDAAFFDAEKGWVTRIQQREGASAAD
jgi:sulfate/thiosulfate transport system substrate-binding protein